MKKIIIVALVIISCLSASMPALSKSTAPSSQARQLQQLKTKIIRVRQKQKISKAKLKRNLLQVKANLKNVKKQRAAVKHKRAVIKARSKTEMKLKK